MRYIIEIEDEPIAKGLYKAKNFKTLTFDEYGLSQMERLIDEPKKEGIDALEVGDEIEIDDDQEGWIGVVTFKTEYGFQIMAADGDTDFFGDVRYTKTGRYFPQVIDLLETMQAKWHPVMEDEQQGYTGCDRCIYMDKAEREYPCVDCTHGGMTGGRSYYRSKGDTDD